MERVAGGTQHHHRLVASLNKQVDQQNAQLEEVCCCLHMTRIDLYLVTANGA